MNSNDSVEVCIRGAGVVGRCLALGLSKQGLSIALQAGQDPPAFRPQEPDIRAYALNDASRALLQSLKVWDALLERRAVTPVHDMRIFGDAAGQLAFSAWQNCVSALAWIVDAGVLDEVLSQAVRFAPHVRCVPENAVIDAKLLAVCEGKDAATRRRLGVEFTRHPYAHHAVAAHLVSDRPHSGCAWQWFKNPEILALLPFDRPQEKASYGLVWSLPSVRAQEVMALAEDDFSALLMQATGAQAGGLTLASGRQSWPLALGRADRWWGANWVLLGDAAHQVHPLSGQGLNLGLGDVAELLRILARRPDWRSVNDEKLLRQYARARDLPTRSVAFLTDGLWHLFSNSQPAVQELRNRGLNLINHLPPLKRWLAARALRT
jgi:ubiquinone biosynthesis UbiH/UbiF/VisC/COQ6 family hydroxylase